MLGAIKYGLSNLFNTSGRDSRQTFWYYVLFVYLLGTLVSVAITLPMMVQIMAETFEGISDNLGDPAAIHGRTMAMMVGIMRPIMWTAIGVGVGNMVLLAASVVRRLHDSNLSGYWALLPGGAQLLALAMMSASIDKILSVMERASDIQQRTANPLAMQSEMMAAQGLEGLIGWVPIVLVIILGIRASTPSPNRFGDTTVQF